MTNAQSEHVEPLIDPRLIEIVEMIKKRSETLVDPEDLQSDQIADEEIYLDLIDQIHKVSYSRNVDEISQAVDTFQVAYQGNTSLSLEYIPSLYTNYAQLLKKSATPSDIQDFFTNYSTNGNWFEQYITLSLLVNIHATAQERQPALQKAQLALSVIPTEPTATNAIYVDYAKKRILSLIAHLHNLQGNSELALSISLEYLHLTEDNPDLKAEVDLINNLIYSYGLSRNHDAQLYLSEQLLEIEKTQSSSVAGLSEMRISGVMNNSGRYENGLDYANRSIEKAKNPIVLRVARVYKAIALAGMGRLNEARDVAKQAKVNLSPVHVLNTETSESDLYLAFLLAQSEDSRYATQIYNRQLDVKAQTFFADNSRDTTAMLAELANSHERQAERDAAAAREAQLQAQTIDRQRKLNRLLILLTFLLGGVALASFLFMKAREKLLRKLEIKTIEAASAEKLKTEFLGMISHELRTPLNGIIGISDFLANYHEDTDIREKTSIILRSGTALLTVVESLTDMARLDAGQLELAPHDVDLSETLASVPGPWIDQAKDKGLTFTHFIDPSLTRHHVDEDRVVQCLNILLANAVRFTESGRVHLHITARDGSGGEVTGLTAIVADTGRGMSELVQSRLFTPFMQADTSRKRSHMGTGLNLAIAYALAEMMGGKLSVMSREARGSEFKLDIPLPAAKGNSNPAAPYISADSHIPQAHLVPEPSPIAEEPLVLEDVVTALPEQNDELEETFARLPKLSSFSDVPVLDSSDAPRREFVDLMTPRPGFPSLHDVEELVLPTPPEGQKCILVVDDMESNRDVLRLILETQGHRCKEAADGFAALAALERQAFDLVVLDIHMAPLDGVETLRRLRGSGKPYANIPVIALTADNAATTNAACMQAGADLFLTKPVSREELLRAISYLLQAQGARILSL